MSAMHQQEQKLLACGIWYWKIVQILVEGMFNFAHGHILSDSVIQMIKSKQYIIQPNQPHMLCSCFFQLLKSIFWVTQVHQLKINSLHQNPMSY